MLNGWKAATRAQVPYAPPVHVPKAMANLAARLHPSLPPSPLSSSFPCMLIQQPGLLGRGFGSGWDVILPARWAMPVWKALVFAGAVVVRVLIPLPLQSRCSLMVHVIASACYLYPPGRGVYCHSPCACSQTGLEELEAVYTSCGMCR